MAIRHALSMTVVSLFEDMALGYMKIQNILPIRAIPQVIVLGISMTVSSSRVFNDNLTILFKKSLSGEQPRM